MAKAIKLFIGTDTYGNQVERAQRFDGVWFSRYSQQTNYGLQMCKWYEDEPSYDTTTTNAYSGEVTEHDPVMAWGFNRMIELTEGIRVRLPN